MAPRSWFRIQARAGSRGRRARIDIFDEIGIGGATASEFARQLRELGDVAEIELHIDSPGGLVGDMLAIYNLLKRHPAAVTVFIDGIAASAASVVAMAGDEIIMPSNTFLLIHNPTGFAEGDHVDLGRASELVRKMTDSVVSIYVRRTDLPADEVRAMMVAVTLLSAEEAVDLGFADTIEDAIAIAANFDLSRYGVSARIPDEKTLRPPPAGTPERAVWDRAVRAGLARRGFKSSRPSLPPAAEVYERRRESVLRQRRASREADKGAPAGNTSLPDAAAIYARRRIALPLPGVLRPGLKAESRK